MLFALIISGLILAFEGAFANGWKACRCDMFPDKAKEMSAFMKEGIVFGLNRLKSSSFRWVAG
jgi:hypothetical protein